MMKALCSKRNESDDDAPPAFGVRHVQVLYLFILLSIGIGMRVHLAVSIVAMTDTKSEQNVPTYDWKNKSVIMSSFYWGYVCLQVVAAELGRKYGPKRFLLGAMFVNSSVMSLIPLVADKLGSYGVMGCRVLMGLAQGFFYCSVHTLLSKWIPSNERTTLSTLALSGASFGTIITMPVVGFICSTSLGWPFAFYLYGAAGFVWTALYFIFGANGPRDHRGITYAERIYIENSKDVEGNKFKVPWKPLLTSIPVWAMLCTQVGSIWGYTTLLNEMPTFMNKVNGFNIQSNGLLSAAPYLTNFILSFMFAAISDYFINNHIISRTLCRKIACTLATFIPGIALIVLGYLPKDSSTLSVVMLVIAVGMQSASTSGYMVNPIDLSPNFSGILVALCNSTSNFVSIFGTIVVQFVVIEETDPSQWRIVFIIAACMFMIPNTLYLIFGTAEVQPWNSPKGVTPTKDERPKKMSVISIMSM